ncbi:MAG: glycosyl hydrolase family 43 [Verrucomicrobia bacterium]|nr:glycosyl hydrolase family 43 [Verrucomicrobiota bacterium]
MKRLMMIAVGLIFNASLAWSSEPNVSAFCWALSGGTRILESGEWYTWCCAPIYGEDGKVHVFVARWPSKTKMRGWLTDSELVHAVADQPEGPYTVLGTILKGGDDAWFRSIYNPNVHRVGDRYVLVFAGQTDGLQQIGLATASSLSGPWTTDRKKPMIACSGKPGSWNCTHASNPSFVAAPDGRFYLYYKGMSDAVPKLRTIGVAVADRLEGPYREHPGNPLLSYVDRGLDIEDPYAFYYRGRFYLIAEDRMGIAGVSGSTTGKPHEGGVRPGLFYESADGFSWGAPQIGYMTNDFYMREPRERFERPQILWKDGKTVCLFLALSGGKHRTSSPAVLKIGDWR